MYSNRVWNRICMGKAISMEALMIVLFLLCLLLAWAALIYRKREKKLKISILQMLEEASSGSFQDKRFDETSVSEVENRMWNYLENRQTAMERIERDRQRMQSQISDIAHQAVLPVSNIVLYTQLLEENLSNGFTGTKINEIENVQLTKAEVSEINSEITAIRDEIGTLDFLIQSLVKLSRMENGIINLNAEKQQIKPMLDLVKQQFAIKAKNKGIDFLIEDTEETAVFDRKWTLEAVANIVDNAVKYTQEGGKISIHTEALPSLVRIDIADTGIGIREEEQGAVFSRFYRSVETSNSRGVGIGLYIAREVMRAQNGYIRLRSEYGNGSTFSLYFLKDEMSQN
mgnify:FL=1